MIWKIRNACAPSSCMIVLIEEFWVYHSFQGFPMWHHRIFPVVLVPHVPPSCEMSCEPIWFHATRSCMIWLPPSWIQQDFMRSNMTVPGWAKRRCCSCLGTSSLLWHPRLGGTIPSKPGWYWVCMLVFSSFLSPVFFKVPQLASCFWLQR